LTTPARTAGKRGKLPARHLALRFIHDYAVATLAAPRYPVDVTGGIGADSWQMLANGPDPTCTTHPDGVSDCGYAGRQHNKMSKAACYGETEQWETSDELVAEYLEYDGGQDNGVVLADVLLAWFKSGKIRGFAPVNHHDPAAVDSAMQEFKGVICGVNLTDDADQLFSEGQPWTVAGRQQPDPAEGHVIVKVKADGRSLNTYVTWGAEQGATLAWTSACQDECWVILTTEDEVAKVDMAALAADIEALHGSGPAPASEPWPPTPAPAPVDHEGLLRELAAVIREDASAALGWLEARGL
jgi:hypothetical protein